MVVVMCARFDLSNNILSSMSKSFYSSQQLRISAEPLFSYFVHDYGFVYFCHVITAKHVCMCELSSLWKFAFVQN